MHRPVVTALLVAPLLGFNLASAVDVCARGRETGVAPRATSAVVQVEAGSDEAYRAGRAWGDALRQGAAPVDPDVACADAATRWAAYEPASTSGSTSSADYRQGCSDALTPG